MPVRILFVAAMFISLLGSPAFAKDWRIPQKSQKAPSGGVRLDPNSPNAPLGPLPPLAGQTWHHWIVPYMIQYTIGFAKWTGAHFRVVNVGTKPVTATAECYSKQGAITYRKKEILKRGRQASIGFRSEWCRVSADGPIVVSAYVHLTETKPRPQGKNSAVIDMRYWWPVPTYPYPAP